MSRIYDNIRKTSFDNTAPAAVIETIDMHTGGEPLRVVISGAPVLKVGSVLEYRRQMQMEHDHFRKVLMWEPRGHADMYGAMLLPPERADSDFSVLFMHNAGYSTMCGHATLALAKLAAELHWINLSEGINTMRIDAPCGQLITYVEVQNGKICACAFDNVPSFVIGLDLKTTLRDGQQITYDLAYGGAFYAYVDTQQFGISVSPEYYSTFIRKGLEIKEAVISSNMEIRHPFEPDLDFLYGAIFTGPPENVAHHSRNVCMFADGEIDRSPTGSGISGRAAINYLRGDLAIGEKITVESIIGSEMQVEIVDAETYGEYHAVIPRVSGDAFITGYHRFVVDPQDPLRAGFFLR